MQNQEGTKQSWEEKRVQYIDGLKKPTSAAMRAAYASESTKPPAMVRTAITSYCGGINRILKKNLQKGKCPIDRQSMGHYLCSIVYLILAGIK